MTPTIADCLDEIRARFAHVDRCPHSGKRVFFENAGGALTLKSVVDVSTRFAAIPDNQGRDNPASEELVRTIDRARMDMRVFFNAPSGEVIVGESGTELLFRLISAACLGTGTGGNVAGSTLEHPASRSAAIRWASIAGKDYVSIPHDDQTGTVTAEDYRKYISADTRVATILHTSPVTGMGVGITAISQVIRNVSPECIIIVDGIQHAAHGQIDIDSYDIDGYVISPYKVFSRHGYGIAWISDRLKSFPHDSLIDGPAAQWELGTRDTGSYATFSEVVKYFDWLGGMVSDKTTVRDRLEAAGVAIHAHERTLTDAMLYGTGNLAGLADIAKVQVIGGIDNPAREGLVSMYVDGMASIDLVSKLQDHGIRVHVRKADHYSGNILKPLGLEDCVRISMCHYNSEQEVAQFLTAIREIAG